MDIARGSHHLARGPLRVVVLRGEVLCRGIDFSPSSNPLIIKAWETFGLEPLEDSEIRTTGMGGIVSTESSYPGEWSIFLDSLSSEDAPSMMITGQSDTGKSTLCTLIANQCITRGGEIHLVDTDVGQSDIGPPTTVGLGCLGRPAIRLTEASLVDAYFAGDTSPAFCLPEVLCGTRLMTDRARDLGGMTVLNTCGLVTGDLGENLTTRIVDGTKPDLLILLERQEELSYLTGLGVESVRLPALPSSRKNLEARRAFRFSQFVSCLRESKINRYDLTRTHVEGYMARREKESTPEGSIMRNDDLALKDLVGLEDTVVGLHRGETYVDIGLLHSVDFDENTIHILTKATQPVDRAVIGNIRITHQGEVRLLKHEEATGLDQ